MGTRGIRVKTRGITVQMREIRVGMRGIRVGMRGIGVGMQGIGVGMRGIRVILCENLRSARGAFHHSVFMGSCPTTSHTYFALSNK